ncbi:hypothetical protein [Candidatus Lokiarchaeum ossiferum]|uniref:hypothetical protein n=1 Tax=Candidatus Lokiarchaeum ossiferum TaxID=2951803 RepID=UPI00352E3E63
MIDRILVMNDAGISYFTWTSDDDDSDANLISGFLTALNMFAKGQSGEVIEEITLNLTTYIFDRYKDLIFVILTKDKEFEKIIRKILIQIRDTFLDLFLEKVTNFNGDVGTFNPFHKNVDSILKSHGYFDYINILKNYDEEDNIRSVLYLSNIDGEVLYSKAKEYFDKKILGFQTMVLIKAVNRIVEERLTEKLDMVTLISSDFRVLEYKNYEDITIVYETLENDSNIALNQKLKPKKVQKILKSPGKLLFEIENPFVLVDNSGNVRVKKDSANNLSSEDSIANALTLYNTSHTIMENIYKEPLFGIILISSKNIYLIFNINEYIVIFLLNPKESNSFQEFLNPIIQFKKSLSFKDEIFLQVLKKFNEFRHKFE